MAYLVIQEDNKWSDVFRLIVGRRVTLGRAPTNSIVVRSEQVSRYHAEIFHTEGHWVVRDLDSRNGTSVGGVRLVSDHALENSQSVLIGKSVLTYYEQLPAHLGMDDAPTLSGLPPQATSTGLELDDSEPSAEEFLEQSGALREREHSQRGVERVRGLLEVSVHRPPAHDPFERALAIGSRRRDERRVPLSLPDTGSGTHEPTHNEGHRGESI